MRMRKRKNLQPRMAACGHWLVQQPEDWKGRWRSNLCGEPNPVDGDGDPVRLNLEIGCGKGGFITQLAHNAPGQKFVAVERVESVLLLAMEKARREELENLRFLSADAARLDSIFAPGEVDRIFLNFSDPWPPKNQHKRRLTHPNFLTVYDKILRKDGAICFKTDNRGLFEDSICYFSQFGYGLFDVTFDLHATGAPNVMTEYERNFTLQGLPIYRLVARKMFPDTPRTDVRQLRESDSSYWVG